MHARSLSPAFVAAPDEPTVGAVVVAQMHSDQRTQL
jgi:hypothetical protein